MKLSFRVRSQALQPSALHAEADVAVRLAQRLSLDPEPTWRSLRIVCSARAVWLLGTAVDLPWVDGVRYFGRDARAPTLLMPSLWEPQLPLDLLELRLSQTLAPRPAPYALLPERREIAVLGSAQPFTQQLLADLLAAHGGGAA